MLAGPEREWSSEVFRQGLFLSAYASFLFVWGEELVTHWKADEEPIQRLVGIVVGGFIFAIPYFVVGWLMLKIQETAVGGVYAPQWLRHSGQTTVALITLGSYALLAGTPRLLRTLGIDRLLGDSRDLPGSAQIMQHVFAGCLALGMAVTQLIWPGAAIDADGHEYLAGAVILSWAGLLLGVSASAAVIGWTHALKLRKAIDRLPAGPS